MTDIQEKFCFTGEDLQFFILDDHFKFGALSFKFEVSYILKRNSVGIGRKNWVFFAEKLSFFFTF